MKSRTQPIVSIRLNDEELRLLNSQANRSKVTRSGKLKEIFKTYFEKDSEGQKNAQESSSVGMYLSEIREIVERISLDTSKQTSKQYDQLNRIQEISASAFAQQLETSLFLASSIYEIELLVSALFDAPEESRTQSRLQNGYGIAREKRVQAIEK